MGDPLLASLSDCAYSKGEPRAWLGRPGKASAEEEALAPGCAAVVSLGAITFNRVGRFGMANCFVSSFFLWYTLTFNGVGQFGMAGCL